MFAFAMFQSFTRQRRRGALVLASGGALVLSLAFGLGKVGAQVQPAIGARPEPTPTPRRVASNPSANQTTQSEQGQRYGAPGFIGEPINLNVVNADIRDILNYITEQYGVNFVIDSEVKSVPVTVNVTDVPWNIALDAILRANRLGVDVNGPVLRVALNESLAKEAALQQQIRAAQLNNAPLYTEFIRLNYARANSTLGSAAGGSGGFRGGGASTGGSSGSGGDVTGGGGDRGILSIINRRLSERGNVEVDGRTNTLIITDVRENIAAIRQLVAYLDQPEPQVEIEVRIVIASRNFSRDLGVQLSAIALNPSRGGGVSGSTLPGTQTVIGNPNPGTNIVPGTPTGVGTAPSPTLAANLASTVIGLTTGVFGTAQISALITAAENKGQIKIVATPRVTALNNRPAEIESGQQIPVVTPQLSGGSNNGSLVFTTTFVSVPLRLSVTPQITDAGTVLLRVVAENNSINTTLAVAGTPGIDTQRMSSEVLVPDGGTTVVGGVLGDNESEIQNRTPGVSGIPLIGNLFKRKSVTRQTNEILFFITPRIARPDLLDSNSSATGVRPAGTILQPVPLGNPSTSSQSPVGTPTNSNTLNPSLFPLGTQPVTTPPNTTQPGGTTPRPPQ